MQLEDVLVWCLHNVDAFASLHSPDVLRQVEKSIPNHRKHVPNPRVGVPIIGRQYYAPTGRSHAGTHFLVSSTLSVTEKQVMPTQSSSKNAEITISCLNCVSPRAFPKMPLRSIIPLLLVSSTATPGNAGTYAKYPIIFPTAIILLAHALPCCCCDTGSVSTISARQHACTALIAKSTT